jgi:hypothetical protein
METRPASQHLRLWLSTMTLYSDIFSKKREL